MHERRRWQTNISGLILATANWSLISILCYKNLVRAGGVVDPVKICLSSSLIGVQNLIAVRHTVFERTGM